MTPEKAGTAALLIGYRKSAIANGSICDGGRLPIGDSQITMRSGEFTSPNGGVKPPLHQTETLSGNQQSQMVGCCDS
jgi:hypothetical protein